VKVGYAITHPNVGRDIKNVTAQMQFYFY